MPRRIKPLRDGHAANVSYLAKSSRAVAIITRDDDGDQLAVPMLRQGTQKDRDDVRPPPRFGYWFKTKLVVENVQITLRWDDENPIGFDVQAFGDEFDRHRRETREDFMKEGCRRSEMIDDNDRHTEIRWQMLEEACVGVETPGGATHADQRKILSHMLRFTDTESLEAA